MRRTRRTNGTAFIIPPPRFRESWIVCLADKWCALEETLAVRLGLTLKE